MHKKDTQIPTPTTEEIEEEKAVLKPHKQVKKLKLPLVCKIIYAIAAVCAVLYVCFIFSPEFSDFFNKYVSPYVRGTLATLTGWIPFSLSEFLLLMVPAIVIAVIVLGVKKYASSLAL